MLIKVADLEQENIAIPEEIKALAKETQDILSSSFFNSDALSGLMESRGKGRAKYDVADRLLIKLYGLLEAIVSADSLPTISWKAGGRIPFVDENGMIVYSEDLNTLKEYASILGEASGLLFEDTYDAARPADSATRLSDWLLSTLDRISY